MSASIGSRVGILPEVLGDLTGPLGDRVKRDLPESSIIAELGGNLREIWDTWGMTKEAMEGIAPRILVGMEHGCSGGPGPRAP